MKYLHKDSSQGANSSGIPPPGASNSSKPMEREDLKPVASKLGKLHLKKTRLSVSTRSSPKSRTR
jgi:hypothetical protein